MVQLVLQDRILQGIMEEIIVILVHRERVENRTMEHIVNVPVPWIHDEIFYVFQLSLCRSIFWCASSSKLSTFLLEDHIVQVVKAIHHELIGQLVDVPLPQMEGCCANVPFP